MGWQQATQQDLAREVLRDKASHMPAGVAIRFCEGDELDRLKKEVAPHEWAEFCGRAKWEQTAILQRRCIARIERSFRQATKPKVNHKARIDARNERRKNVRAGNV